MLVRSLGLFVVEIPKNGSTAIKEAIEAQYGKVSLPGHLTISQMAAHAGEHPAAAVWRDPIDRFVSAMNFTYGDTPGVTLQDAFNGWWRHRRRVVFQPQSEFLDGPCVLFRSVGELLDTLGCETVTRNQSVKRWTREEITSHPGIEAVLQFYADDLQPER